MLRNWTIAGAFSWILGAIFALALSSALAEQPGTAPDLDTQTYVKMLREQRDAAMQRAANAEAEYTAAVTAFRKKEQDMAAYLKACGDKAGCSVPVE